MTIQNHKQLNSQIYSEASDWLVEFRACDIDPAGCKAFIAWLRTSPEHVRAYLELAAIWNEGSGLDPNRTFDDATLARESQLQSNVITVPTSHGAIPASGSSALLTEQSSREATTPKTSMAPFMSLAASLIVALVGIGGWLYLQRGVYTTGTGEQRTLALSDGSRIELNAQSKVRVRFSDSERSIDLLRGQGFFQVAKDPHRPLVVVSDGTRVRAVGTQFGVYRKKTGTVVTVVEGKVAVSSARAAGAPAVLPPARDSFEGNDSGGSADVGTVTITAGEQVIVTARATVKQTRPNVSAATAWTQGRLVFQAASLQDVADEFNRYNTRPLIIRDAQLATFNITGVFASTDTASLIRFLEARPDIVVTETDDEIWVLRKE